MKNKNIKLLIIIIFTFFSITGFAKEESQRTRENYPAKQILEDRLSQRTPLAREYLKKIVLGGELEDDLNNYLNFLDERKYNLFYSNIFYYFRHDYIFDHIVNDRILSGLLSEIFLNFIPEFIPLMLHKINDTPHIQENHIRRVLTVFRNWALLEVETKEDFNYKLTPNGLAEEKTLSIVYDHNGHAKPGLSFTNFLSTLALTPRSELPQLTIKIIDEVFEELNTPTLDNLGIKNLDDLKVTVQHRAKLMYDIYKLWKEWDPWNINDSVENTPFYKVDTQFSTNHLNITIMSEGAYRHVWINREPDDIFSILSERNSLIATTPLPDFLKEQIVILDYIFRDYLKITTVDDNWIKNFNLILDAKREFDDNTKLFNSLVRESMDRYSAMDETEKSKFVSQHISKFLAIDISDTNSIVAASLKLIESGKIDLETYNLFVFIANYDLDLFMKAKAEINQNTEEELQGDLDRLLDELLKENSPPKSDDQNK